VIDEGASIILQDEAMEERSIVVYGVAPALGFRSCEVLGNRPDAKALVSVGEVVVLELTRSPQSGWRLSELRSLGPSWLM